MHHGEEPKGSGRKAWCETRNGEKLFRIVGVENGEGPPVPIPNTEVKLTGAENTWTATSREDRKATSREDRKTPTQDKDKAKVLSL